MTFFVDFGWLIWLGLSFLAVIAFNTFAWAVNRKKP